ncbi:hypothetical protein [Nonomuraea pusilla]|uniref:Uncharacterized protein n=1 Tax=Nonomuraea pusilla TaxID=46177 RepID=A0A1H8DVW6_9ACTN|nr:hypothetical protein [Nonomuraea pusilla]SEN11315.1 hypothetical protein SAMN05660976_06822 [Nonomuraea pusilla]
MTSRNEDQGRAGQEPGAGAGGSTGYALLNDLRGAFRRFYVWRDAQGGWRARPLPKPTIDEIAFGVLPELAAETPLELAFVCTWQRSRRNVHRYLQKYALERPCRGS